MKTVDIEKLKEINEELANLEKDEVLFVNKDGSGKYVLMPMDLYETVEDVIALSKTDVTNSPNIRIINGSDFELTYDEYETVKKQIMDAFEKTFKPKPEKLN